MNNKNVSLLVIILTFACLTGCKQPKDTNFEIRDQLYQSRLDDIRLGDGVPLDVEVAIRWRITNMVDFHTQFSHPRSFDTLILAPRGREVANRVANSYPSVDSVFGSWRQKFILALKTSFQKELGEKGLLIEEVIIPEIHFPTTYTQALEASGMKERELEALRQKNEVDIAAAQANRKRATAEGEVRIEHARMEGKLQQIQAKTEEIRRRTELAKAETQRQVSEKQALAEKKRATLMAEAEVVKVRALKKAEADHKRELEMIQVDKQKAFDQAGLEKEMKIAKLCAANPTYATYVVNKELASKVQIAVLPSNMDGNVFGNLLNFQNSAPKQALSEKKD